VGIQDGSAYSRPFVAPPGTPKERVQILRKAFQETLNDKALLAEAEKAKLTLDPVAGEELEKMIADLFTLDPSFVEKLKAVLYK
jgi:tripartite-type tricarboxylate transporter receptor subunit TctC